MIQLLEKKPIRNRCVPIRWTPQEAEMVEYGAWMKHEWSVSGFMREIVLDHIKKQGVPAEYDKYLQRRAQFGNSDEVVTNKV